MTARSSKAGARGWRGGSGRWAGTLASLALLALLALLVPAADASAAQGSPSNVAKTLQRAPGDVREYWTPERMRTAQPVERRLHRGPTPRALRGAAEPSRRAAAEQADSNTYPGRTHGKVFFRMQGMKFVCSGTVVTSGGRNLVLTAGHCVYDEVAQRFATNWMFVPGFRDGEKPFGEWAAQRLATTTRFASNGDERWDVGVAVVRRDHNGRGVQDVVGARGIAFNQPRDQFYRAFGYPATGRFDGRRLYRCDSDYDGEDREFSPPRPMRIDCDMAGGSSGGGWVVDDSTVVSVTSYGYEYPPLVCMADPSACPERDKLFGPYFGSTIHELYRANRGRALRCGGRIVTNRGTRGPDRLVGTLAADVMHGLGADDVLRGRAGDDVICGGRGGDRIFGGPGDDRIYAGRGADRIFGGAGDNRIFAGRGSDRVFVRARGNNRIVARQGRNRIRCGPGRDVVITNQRSRVHRSCNRVIRR